MTHDTLRFAPDKANLSEEAKTALDEFAARIKADGKPVFIEIQGHTDSRGPAAYNERLGLMRAEAVRSYLHRKGGLPLARMSAISYGHTEPVADNRTREGRMQNRRVVLVVLQ
jgi:outer membrane protein OmpA-like peptidoglycan-associated protein